MTLSRHTTSLILVGGVASLLTVLIGSLYLFSRLSEHRHYIDRELGTIETSFLEASERADRTEVSASSTHEVFDCALRSEFESLLSRLESLTNEERSRLDELFPQCADFYHRLKLYHVGVLNNYLNEYSLHLTHRSHFYNEDEVLRERERLMRQIVEKERERADAMHEQVVVQRDIITALGSSGVNDPALIDRIGSVGWKLGEVDASIDTARAELVRSIK